MAFDTANTLYGQASDDVQDSSYDFAAFLKYFNEGLKEISGRVYLPALETSADVYVGTATITATTISFTASSKTIADSGKGLVTAGFHVGETITITGAGEATNNQTTTITSIQSDGSEMVVAGTLADEAAGQSVTIVNNGPSEIPLPSNYQRNLFYCYSLTYNRPVQVYKSKVLLQRAVGRFDLAGRVIGVAVKGNRLYYQRIPGSTEQLRISFYEHPTPMADENGTPDCLPEEFASQLMISYANWKIFSKIEDGIEGAKVNTTFWKREFEGNGPMPGGGETGGLMARLQDRIGPENRIPEEIPDDFEYEAYL